MRFIHDYVTRLNEILSRHNWEDVAHLADALLTAWREQRQVFLCGNGGSAANAIHLANDLLYGVSKDVCPGLRVHALPANQSVMTCLANDISYDDIFSHQLEVFGKAGDILIAFSGSGNSPNIVKAIEKANALKMQTFALLGYSGGKSLKLVGTPIHFPIDDMQIAEDCQQIVGHMLMRLLAGSLQDQERKEGVGS